MKYSRVLLKLSGEAIGGDDEVFNLKTVERIADEIKKVQNQGTQIGIVIGGGNIIRGNELARYGISRIQSDSMGMLATVMNSILLEEVLLSIGVPSMLQSALPIDTIAEGIVLKKTMQSLESGRVVLFAGGTGSPYFTTDTAAALRACEIGADVLMKATKVDGVFDKDPELYKDSIFFKFLTYDEMLSKQLKVMDMAAVSMCRDNKISMIIFNIFKENAFIRAVRGDDIGTTIEE